MDLLKTQRWQQLPDGGRSALEHLLKAFVYARELKVDPWEFALQLRHLSGLSVCDSDLRWLIAKGYLECADELTTFRDAARRFRPRANLAFGNRTCFVLSEAGAALADARLKNADAAGPAEVVTIHFPAPHWDSDRRVLSFGGELVKPFRFPAPNQERVLSAFQEENWPYTIDDPLSRADDVPPKRRLNETIKSLNANQACRLVRFRGDGSGERIRWEPFRAGVSSDEGNRRAA